MEVLEVALNMVVKAFELIIVTEVGVLAAITLIAGIDVFIEYLSQGATATFIKNKKKKKILNEGK